MVVKTARRFSYQGEQSSLLVGARPGNSNICYYYVAGKCNRNPCRFVHSEPTTSSINPKISGHLPEDRPRKCPYSSGRNNVWVNPGTNDRSTHDRIGKTPNYSIPKNSLASSAERGESEDKNGTMKTPPKVCQHWLSGNCVKGDNCRFIHSWFCGNGLTMLAKLNGHKKAVSGIALPLGSDKLYSGSRDGTTRLWDCHTGQCATVINHGAEVGSMICEGPWIFIGMPNVVKAWNIESSAEFCLQGPVGQVYCMVVSTEMLFAGTQDGDILAWKGSSSVENPFHLTAYLKGHTHVVTCLAVGGKMLYSGSMDNTIRVWDLDTLQHVMTLDAHTDAPMSLLCWDQYLVSCSLDHTIKVWVAAEGGNLEVTYTHNEEHGVLALGGLNDADGKPVLLCACNDNSLHLYELPSFVERSRIFSKREVRTIQVGPDGLFFTGDGSGMLSVWKLLPMSKV